MDEPGTDFLIQRCRNGNLNAFEQLVALYESKIYGLSLRLTGNQTDAQDLSQEAFIRLYKSLHSFRGQSAFSTWFYRIVVNLWSNELRKRAKQKTVSLDAPVKTDDGQVQRSLASDYTDGPEELLSEKEDRESVWLAINSLSEEHRVVIILREMYDLSYDEIANALGCSEGTVKSRLNRARKNLAQILSDRFNHNRITDGKYKKVQP